MNRRVHIVIVILMLLVAIVQNAAELTPLFRPGGFRPDFAVFWTAARMLAIDNFPLYDAQAMTAAQSWLVDPAKGLRPFVYPPTALLLFTPLASLPFPLACLVWSLLSFAAFFFAARQFVPREALLLSILSPPVVLALSSGQTSLLVGAAISCALSLLDRRPIIAGLLFGAAAVVKPQALFLLPVALTVGRHWRALLASLITAMLLGLVTAALWGIALWPMWVQALKGFAPIVAGLNLPSSGVALPMLASAAGWPPPVHWLLQLLALIGGLMLVILAFRRNDKALQLIALVGGSLFSAPYALGYDLAPLMPVAAMMMLDKKGLGALSAWPFTGLAGVAAVPLLVAGALTARPSDRTAQPRSAVGRDDQHGSVFKGAE